MNGRNCRAYTLLEVVLAVAIVGATAGTMLVVLAEAVHRGADAADLRLLTLAARERLAELEVGDAEQSAGPCAGAYASFRYEYTRRPIELAAEPNEPIELVSHRIRVHRDDGLAVDLVVLRPPASVGAKDER